MTQKELLPRNIGQAAPSGHLSKVPLTKPALISITIYQSPGFHGARVNGCFQNGIGNLLSQVTNEQDQSPFTECLGTHFSKTKVMCPPHPFCDFSGSLLLSCHQEEGQTETDTCPRLIFSVSVSLNTQTTVTIQTCPRPQECSCPSCKVHLCVITAQSVVAWNSMTCPCLPHPSSPQARLLQHKPSGFVPP